MPTQATPPITDPRILHWQVLSANHAFYWVTRQQPHVSKSVLGFTYLWPLFFKQDCGQTLWLGKLDNWAVVAARLSPTPDANTRCLDWIDTHVQYRQQGHARALLLHLDHVLPVHQTLIVSEEDHIGKRIGLHAKIRTYMPRRTLQFIHKSDETNHR